MDVKSILVVFNSGAGTNDKEAAKSLIEDFFANQPYHVSWYYTTGQDDNSKLHEAVKKISIDLLLASGGDGTCNLAANVAIGENIPLAIIPSGSANALAKELNIPLNQKQALELIGKGKISKIDYLRVNGTICIRQAGLGVNAQLIRSFESSSSRGMLMYVKHFLQNMFRWRSFSVKVKADSKWLKKRHVISLTVASSRKYGTGALINPTGSIDDGKFEIVLIRSFPWYSLPSLCVKFFSGKIHESIYSETIRCQEAEVYLKRKKLLQIDGELSGRSSQVKVSIVRNGLSILTP